MLTVDDHQRITGNLSQYAELRKQKDAASIPAYDPLPYRDDENVTNLTELTTRKGGAL